MKISRLLIVSIGILAIAFFMPNGGWAGGAGATPGICCEVSNPGGGALLLKTTSAIWFATAGGVIPGGPIVDVTLRVERGGVQNFYRATFNHNIFSEDDNLIACRILNDCSGVFTSIADDILWDFFQATPNEKELVVVPSSVSETDYESEIPSGTGRYMRIAEINIYAIDKRP